MSKRDQINPKANAWMAKEGVQSSARVRQPESARGVPQRAMSAQILRLASRLEADPDEIAKKIPADTLRRTKYPVIEQIEPDGTRRFLHDAGIEEGPRAL